MRRFFLCSQNNDSKNYGFIQSVFFQEARPNFAKRKRMEQAEDSSPDPSSSACDIRIQEKRISRSFAESFPQKIVSAKLRPHCFRFPRQDCFQKRFEFCTMNTADLSAVKILTRADKTILIVWPNAAGSRW